MTIRRIELRDEIERRESNTDALEQFFRAHPHAWHRWDVLAQIAGACAWRTRCSDLRTKKHMRIEWNKSNRESAYRYVPQEFPLGPPADQYRPATLF